MPTGYFFVLAAVFFVVWLYVERRSLQPLVDVTLLATNRSVRHGVLLVVTPSLLTSGIMFFVPVCLLQWLGCTPVQIGWVMILYPVTRILTGPVAGRLADRGCAFRVMQAGLILFAVAFFGFAAAMGHASVGVVVVFVALVGAANSCLGPVATAWLMNRTPRHQQGMVSGLYQTLNVISNMMGVCVFETLYSISHNLAFGCQFVCLFGIGVCLVVFWTVFGRSHTWTEATDFAG